MALGTGGYDVCEACGGEEGLERALKEPFDLILLDTVMPDLDGLEVLRRIREAYSEVELPIIMLLAQAHSSRCRQGPAARCQRLPGQAARRASTHDAH